jgi:hypothetical protein
MGALTEPKVDWSWSEKTGKHPNILKFQAIMKLIKFHGKIIKFL